ncbi:MAG: LamG-like jellyroll fold domain-containing protein, partial [Bacteroidota bacterium]
MKKICLLFIAWGFLWPAMAQEVPEPVADWVFHPNYMLPRNAANYPGERIDAPESEFARMRLMGPPIWLYGHAPTERKTDLMHGKEIPRNAFSVEGWILNHVNQPVGSMIAARGRSLEEPVSWLLGYHHDSVFLRLTPDEKPPVELNVSLERGWKKYWLHVVGTFDGEVARLFVNGKEAATQTLGKTALQWSDAPQVEV